MTTQDIMIGDWVFFPEINRHVVVTTIYDNGIITVNDQVTSYLANRPITPHLVNRYMRKCDMFEPITLTPNILMKNGFREDRPGITYRFRRNEEATIDIVDVFFHNNGEITVSINGTTNDIYVNSIHCHCKYVHELQHALKLCGIEKTIEL